ncbi:developmental regulator protein [Rutstroemia sp. NJR-2017a BBW]|nr:developmental regulator protein [Rutstroemia sp. NJR-2017a BBW]
MNTAYASPPRDMHPRATMPSIHDPAYRAAPAPTGPPYSMPHTMPPIQPPHQQLSAYEQYNNTLPLSRPPPQEHLGSSEGLSSISPGAHPPNPIPRSLIDGGRKYELVVVQQPRRARMCGFGDKDRRPITPPPCVRLVITDSMTGKEIDVNSSVLLCWPNCSSEIEHGMYVLNVDLWSADGKQEVNLVRHSQTSPSISSTVPVSYAQVESGQAYAPIVPGQQQREPTSPPFGGPQYQGGTYNPYPGPPQVNAYSPQHNSQQPPYGNSQYQSSYAGQPPNGGNGNYQSSNSYQQQASSPPPPASQGVQSHTNLAAYNRAFASTPHDLNITRLPVSSTSPTGMYTRNLIGSLSASAFRLTDPDDRIGIWFVLQDLSVRTEGDFRLRFSFVNVGMSAMAAAQQNNGPQNQSSLVNTGKAPVLASCYSEVFKVYSAKRFPGVVESTPLSKCFATQGIKIPIRKDGPGKGKDGRGGGDEYDDE